MNGGESYGRIQIVVHACFEIFQRSLRRRRKLFVASRFGLCFFNARAKVAEAGNSFLSAAQRIKREIELLARWNAEQKITNCRRSKSFLDQIAIRVVISFRL